MSVLKAKHMAMTHELNIHVKHIKMVGHGHLLPLVFNLGFVIVPCVN